MKQPSEQFEREQGCTEAEWLGWLPVAVHGHPLHRNVPGEAIVEIDAGTLTLRWQPLEPRQIALIRLPRMRVQYRFDGVDEAARRGFMRLFDLHIQRGGG
ncbi:MAG: hypothetical protein MUF03_08100 [Rubrivivax sp.]|jgi:hypothetical protein|nr:hypothetical protein [Rubrivivax sp.]